MSKAFRITISLAAGYFFYKVVYEFYQVAPGKGIFLGRFSPIWGIVFLIFTILCLLLLIGVLFVQWFLDSTRSDIGVQAIHRLSNVRSRLGKTCWFIAIAVIVAPSILFLYTYVGFSFTTPYIRLLVLLITSAIFAVCINKNPLKMVEWSDFFLGMVLVASVFLVTRLLTNVTNYPFSLTWSEGNRLYDYSIYSNPDRYRFSDDLETPYNSPGRYLLWGVLFLIPGTPIWLHRLWDTFLWCVPCFALGYIQARQSNLDVKTKWLYAMWIFLFLEQGPIYPSLILSASLVVLLVRDKNWIASIVGAAIAGFYASASRKTWLPASSAWSALILIAKVKLVPTDRFSKKIRSIAPIALVVFISLAAGGLALPDLFAPKEMFSSMAFSQPLLWYRLFPNTTYTSGILVGLLIAVGPVIALLIWLAITKRWSLNWLQVLTYLGVSLVFLAIGLVASVKIGGGSNLHNLDMFLITLAILTGLILRERKLTTIQNWPKYIHIVVIIALFLPSWEAFRKGTPLELPQSKRITQALNFLYQKVSKAQKEGEVLFIDQRQLITFGYINDVPMISQYEKKYMMDHAMAGDAVYFDQFYDDLRSKRFSLIVIEPQFTREQDASRRFNEENNAWVKWISRPLLCYYDPQRSFTDVNLQILTPRTDPTGCP